MSILRLVALVLSLTIQAPTQRAQVQSAPYPTVTDARRARRSLAARRLGSAAGGHHGIPEFDGCA